MRSRKYRVVTTLERGSNWLIRHALRAGYAPAQGVPPHPPPKNHAALLSHDCEDFFLDVRNMLYMFEKSSR
jgi:hypothetical protein